MQQRPLPLRTEEPAMPTFMKRGRSMGSSWSTGVLRAQPLAAGSEASSMHPIACAFVQVKPSPLPGRLRRPGTSRRQTLARCSHPKPLTIRAPSQSAAPPAHLPTPAAVGARSAMQVTWQHPSQRSHLSHATDGGEKGRMRAACSQGISETEGAAVA